VDGGDTQLLHHGKWGRETAAGFGFRVLIFELNGEQIELAIEGGRSSRTVQKRRFV
jgi:hypothetical protein